MAVHGCARSKTIVIVLVPGGRHDAVELGTRMVNDRLRLPFELRTFCTGDDAQQHAQYNLYDEFDLHNNCRGKIKGIG